MRKTLVLLSGGLNSSCLLSLLIKYDSEIHAVSFNYGQESLCELRCAEILAARANVKSHEVLKIDFLKKIFRSSYARTETKRVGMSIRNAIEYFAIGAAAIIARHLEIRDLFVGSSRCEKLESQTFGADLTALTEAAKAISAALHYEVKVQAPLISMNKADVIRLAMENDAGRLLVDSYSCLSNTKYPCGKCEGCLVRRGAFQKVGIEDPIRKRIELESSFLGMAQ